MTLKVALAFLLIAGTQAGPPAECTQAAEARRRGDLTEAERLLQTCLDLHPNDITPYLWLSALYQEQKRQDDLYAIATLGLKRFPGERRFYLAAASGALREGSCGQAITILTEGLRRWQNDRGIRGNLSQAYLCRGMDYLDKNENRKAESDFLESLKLEGRNTEAWLNLGRAQHNLQHSGDALKSFDRALQLDPETPLVQFHRGVALSALGRFDEAVEALDKQLSLNPEHGPSFYFRGVAFFYKGNWERAFGDLKKAVELMPEFNDAVYRLGRCLEHFGDNERAEAAFRKSARLDPSDVRPLYALGNLLSKTGRAEEASEIFRKAVETFEKKVSDHPERGQFRSP